MSPVTKERQDESYSARRCVVIWGTSVFLMSIEAGLAKLPGMEVVRLNPHLPGAEARIMALAPDVVVVERSDNHAGQARTLLSHGLPLVELDASRNVVTVLSGRRVQVSETEDLARLIEQVATGDPSADAGSNRLQLWQVKNF